MHTEVTIQRCPECDFEVSHTVRHSGFAAGGTSIGPSSINCPGCGAVLETNTSEWDEKGLVPKMWFVFTRLIWWIVSSLTFGACSALILAKAAVEFEFADASQEERIGIVAFSSIAFLLAVLFVRKAYQEIRDSLERMDDQGNFET